MTVTTLRETIRDAIDSASGSYAAGDCPGGDELADAVVAALALRTTEEHWKARTGWLADLEKSGRGSPIRDAMIELIGGAPRALTGGLDPSLRRMIESLVVQAIATGRAGGLAESSEPTRIVISLEEPARKLMDMMEADIRQDERIRVIGEASEILSDGFMGAAATLDQVMHDKYPDDAGIVPERVTRTERGE